MKGQKTIVVTGASRGIGRAVAMAFGKLGWNVVVSFQVQEKAAQDTARAIEQGGGQALVVQTDVRDRKSIRHLFGKTLGVFRAINVLVNNAGILLKEDSLSATEEGFDQQFRVNVLGLYFCAVEAAVVMKNQEPEEPESSVASPARGGIPLRGRIINLSSIAGRGPAAPGMTVYGATKAAVDSLTKSLAAEWAPYGILVNAVAPGATQTDMLEVGMTPEMKQGLARATSLKCLGSVEDIVRIIVFLSQNVWIVGQSINASGGLLI